MTGPMRLDGSLLMQSMQRAPCDTCENFYRCKFAHLACRDFSRFVNGGSGGRVDRKPRRDIYQRIFETEEQSDE